MYDQMREYFTAEVYSTWLDRAVQDYELRRAEAAQNAQQFLAPAAIDGTK